MGGVLGAAGLRRAAGAGCETGRRPAGRRPASGSHFVPGQGPSSASKPYGPAVVVVVVELGGFVVVVVLDVPTATVCGYMGQ